MSNPTATPVALAYRHQVALSAATGAAISPAAFMAFGSGAAPYSPDEDTALAAEFVRVPVAVEVVGPELKVTGVLTGAQAGANVLREVAVFTAAGVLMGRRVMKPKEFEDSTELEIEIVFEY